MHKGPGDYGFTPLLDEYQPRLSELRPWDERLGLKQQVVYLYGGFRTAEGVQYAVERKFIGPMTAGLWIMNDAEGGQRLLPGSVRSTRGEVRRHFDDDGVSYADQLMARLGEELAPVGEQSLDLRIDDGSLDWSEGELLGLTGPLVGPGLQIHTPMQDEAFFYVSQLYRVEGTAMGEEVVGFVWLDHGYWPHGRDWKEFRIFKDLQIGWEVFANEHDGTIEWGHLCHGRQGFTFGAILTKDGLVSHSTDVDVAMDLDDEHFVPRATFVFGDDTWEWEADPKGPLRQFSTARWGGYRAQVGHTRRRGDDRAVAHDFTWLECFADRIREDEVPPVG
ncbi:MAG: hypothetical protein KY469_04255 [Actinobacteria bacterium]|nr:hypothetical protein [Actinomycetota bacterium]